MARKRPEDQGGGGDGSGNFLGTPGHVDLHCDSHSTSPLPSCIFTGNMSTANEDRFRFLRSLGDESDDESGDEGYESDVCSSLDEESSTVTMPLRTVPGLFGEDWDSEDDYSTDEAEWFESDYFMLPDTEKEDKELLDFLDSL
jgi:hypothetical protein